MGSVLSIDFGTSNTAAVLRMPDGRAEALLFDGSPLLPSAVFAPPDGGLLTGRDAIHSQRVAPERFEPNPKLRVDDGTVLMGAEIPVTVVFAAVLGRVWDEARQSAGGSIDQVVLTHPAGWGPRRRAVAEEAAGRAGLGEVTLEPEPVAAARYLSTGTETPPVVVYDFGGGTFDVSVVAGGHVLATEGLADTGGLDIEAALIAYLEATYRERDPTAWDRLRNRGTPQDRRAWWQFTEDVRAAKEMLSRTSQAFVHIPLLGVEAPIGREQVEAIAAPLINRTVTATKSAISAAGLALPPPGPVFLVGGASRMPLVATMLHRQLRTAPTIAEQPELVVARGALLGLPSAGTPVPASGEGPRSPRGARRAERQPSEHDRREMPAVTRATPEPSTRATPEAPTRVTFATTRNQRMAYYAKVSGAIPLFIPVVGAVNALVEGDWEGFSANFGRDLGVLVLIMAGCALLGSLVGLVEAPASLSMDSDELTIERMSRTPRTVAIRWDSVRRVSVTKGRDAVVVWFTDGHQPDTSAFASRSLTQDGGWIVCFLRQVIGPPISADQRAEFQAALARFAGDRYV